MTLTFCHDPRSSGTRRTGFAGRRILIGALLLLVPAAAVTIGLVLVFSPQELGDPTFILKPKGLSQEHLLFSPDGEFLVVASRSLSTLVKDPAHLQAELSIWNVANGELRFNTTLPQWVKSMSISAKGDLLAVTLGSEEDEKLQNPGTPREIRLYSFPAMKEQGRIASEGLVRSAVLSPDGKYLATGGALPAQVKLWDARTLKLHKEIKGVEFGTFAVRFSPDGSVLAASDWSRSPTGHRGDAMIRQFSTKTGEALKSLEVPGRSEIRDFQYLPDAKKIVVDSDDVAIIDTDSGVVAKLWDADRRRGPARAMAFSRDGKWLFFVERYTNGPTSRSEPKMIAIELARKSPHLKWQMKPEEGAVSIAVSPDMSKLALGGGGKVRLFDLKKVLTLPAPQ